MSWHGPELSLYEVACLDSFIAHGGRIALYSYANRSDDERRLCTRTEGPGKVFARRHRFHIARSDSFRRIVVSPCSRKSKVILRELRCLLCLPRVPARR